MPRSSGGNNSRGCGDRRKREAGLSFSVIVGAAGFAIIVNTCCLLIPYPIYFETLMDLRTTSLL